MSTALQHRDQTRAVIAKLMGDDNFLRSLEAMSVGHDLDKGRLAEATIAAIQSSERLKECTAASKGRAMLQAARVGLEPDGVLAYLVPQRNKGVAEVEFRTSYQGELAIVRRFVRDKTIHAEVIRENDFFEYDPAAVDPNYPIKHRFGDGSEADRGEIVGAWAHCMTLDGSYYHRYCTLEDLDRAEKSSKASYNGRPWQAHRGEMSKKTALRRLTKVLPKAQMMPWFREIEEEEGESTEVVQATIVDDQGSRASVLLEELESQEHPATVDLDESDLPADLGGAS